MSDRYHFSSVTRVSPLSRERFTVVPRGRDEWRTGDYVVCEVSSGGSPKLELATGRGIELAPGDRFVAALGTRAATLESAGDWRETGPEGEIHLLTGAGLLGRITSRSPFLSAPATHRYCGHVILGGEKATMKRFLPLPPRGSFRTPTVALVGTSMSSGKTTAATTLVRRLAGSGRRVLAAKLIGAARYRDIQAMGDAGAKWIYDFVDAGLPSTVCPEDEFRPLLDALLSRMAAEPADVAVVELGASPHEPYNGIVALDAIREATRIRVLAASDAYAACGLVDRLGDPVDLVCGPAANTRAGIAFTERLCGVKTLNLADPRDLGALDRLLEEKLGR